MFFCNRVVVNEGRLVGMVMFNMLIKIVVIGVVFLVWKLLVILVLVWVEDFVGCVDLIDFSCCIFLEVEWVFVLVLIGFLILVCYYNFFK